jgi:hypothetical protein
LEHHFYYPLNAMTIQRTIVIGAAILPMLLLAGCRGGSSPRGVIPQEEFADLYLDLLAAAEQRFDTSAAAIAVPADTILARRGVTLEEYRKTIAWYNRDPESWRGFFAGVIRKGTEREKQEMENQK